MVPVVFIIVDTNVKKTMPASRAEYALLQRKYKYENMLKRISSHREAARGEREREVLHGLAAQKSRRTEWKLAQLSFRTRQPYEVIDT